MANKHDLSIVLKLVDDVSSKTKGVTASLSKVEGKLDRINGFAQRNRENFSKMAVA